MNPHFKSITLAATGATSLFEIQVIQNLWSGYGKLVRYGLKGSPLKSIVVKHVRLPENTRHPRGWNTDLGHERKRKSYQVESNFYHQWAPLCANHCRIPQCLALESDGDEVWMVLEDLTQAGYPNQRTAVSSVQLKACLVWLANFHVTYLGQTPEGLWETGTYWHLETRPDELNVLTDKELKKAARAIDLKLQNSPFQTFVHGDAKLANFCFSEDGTQVAAVDFQYVGGGCGMKDVAYFIGSCLYEDECEQREEELLDLYFEALKKAVVKNQNPVDATALEENWRALYPVAWTDFHRFLKGWSPDHWKINSYSERLAREVVAQINMEQYTR